MERASSEAVYFRTILDFRQDKEVLAVLWENIRYGKEICVVMSLLVKKSELYLLATGNH